MAIKLSSNPTCVLSDADNLTAEQRQKINMNLTKDIPGSNISGDKVTVINSDGEVEMKAYSAGGGGSSYTAGDGIDITSDVISAKIDGSTITLNASGELQASSSETPCLINLNTATNDEVLSAVSTAVAANQVVFGEWKQYDWEEAHYLQLVIYHNNNGYISMIFRLSDYSGGDLVNTYSVGYYKEGPSAEWTNQSNVYQYGAVPMPDYRPADGTTLQFQNGSMTWVAPN